MGYYLNSDGTLTVPGLIQRLRAAGLSATQHWEIRDACAKTGSFTGYGFSVTAGTWLCSGTSSVSYKVSRVVSRVAAADL